MANTKKPGKAGDAKDENPVVTQAEEANAIEATNAVEAKEAAEANEPATPNPPPPPKHAEQRKAAWGAPIAKVDRAWTKLEARLCAGVLIAEVITLVFWISIRALSATGSGGPGQLFRQLLTALVIGGITFRFVKKHPRSQIITTAAVIAGVILGSYWGDAGTKYFSNLFAWIQNSSVLVFFGGVSDLAKRFTLWVALLGASLATAQGKHINVDVVMRFLTPKMRVPIAVTGWLAAALVAISASWGFFDYVAVEEMRAPPTVPCPGEVKEGEVAKRCPAPMASKVDVVAATFSRDMFLTSRQISLDLRSLPKVLTGTRYNESMTPHEWNEWLRGGNWESHFKAEDVKAFEVPEDGSGPPFRNPAVTVSPGTTDQIAKICVPLVNLVFAFGLFVIGIRFIMRSLLAISGWIKVDPNAAHGDDDLAHAHDASPQATAVDHATQEGQS